MATRKILFWKKMFYHNNPVLQMNATSLWRQLLVCTIYNTSPDCKL